MLRRHLPEDLAQSRNRPRHTVLLDGGSRPNGCCDLFLGNVFTGALNKKEQQVQDLRRYVDGLGAIGDKALV
jgi:hypothetical protein